ncbi:MAG: hypothetical protein JWN76_39 [Chitinophagaceae bacterium]|nr:hypothetical protein [Chitinophagaceae bacterium]
MQTKILAAIYVIVKDNSLLPLFPKNISDISGCDQQCIEDHFKTFEEEGYLERKYPSFMVYSITRSGLLAAEAAYRQSARIA